MDTLSADFLHALSGHSLREQMISTGRRVSLHRGTGSRYIATDRELNVLAMLIAQQELGEKPGRFRFPGGAVVDILGDPEDEASYSIEGQAMPADFPPEVRDHLRRWPPETQAERDATLLAGETESQIQARLQRHKKELRLRSLKSRRRDILLLARNRRAVGLEPLEEEQDLPDIEQQIEELEEELG